MDQTAPPSLADRFAIPLDGMRAAMAAEGKRKGPAGLLQAAILRLLERLVALLAELCAGTLAAAGQDHATPAAGPACATSAEPAAAELSPTRQTHARHHAGADRGGAAAGWDPAAMAPCAGDAAVAGMPAVAAPSSQEERPPAPPGPSRNPCPLERGLGKAPRSSGCRPSAPAFCLTARRSCGYRHPQRSGNEPAFAVADTHPPPNARGTFLKIGVQAGVG
jgi:hypothetical protein